MNSKIGVRRQLQLTLSQISSWQPAGYLLSSGELLAWLLLRALAQVATILLLTQYLGANGYGLFVTTLAISSFFVPLAGLGMHGILLRDGARNPTDLPQLLGTALALWWPSTLLFSLLAFLVEIWLSPTALPLVLLAAFVFAEIVSSSLVELASRVEQSQQRTRAFGTLQAGLPLSRSAGLLLCASLTQPDMAGWISAYAASSLAYTSAVAWWIKKRYRPSFLEKRDWSMARNGLPFTMGALSFRLQGEFNKPMLAQIGYAQAGNFSAAQRVVDLASLPLMAMQETLWSRYYTNHGAHQHIWLASLFLVASALLGGILLTFSAPLLPYILGSEFEATITLLVYLAWLPTLQVMRNLMNATIISQNRQLYLTWVYLGSGLTSILLNSILVPHLGLSGAIWSTYLAELFALLILLANLLLYRK